MSDNCKGVEVTIYTPREPLYAICGGDGFLGFHQCSECKKLGSAKSCAKYFVVAVIKGVKEVYIEGCNEQRQAD